MNAAERPDLEVIGAVSIYALDGLTHSYGGCKVDGGFGSPPPSGEPVSKKNGTVRICLDYTRLNRSIQRERFQLPLAEEMFAKLPSLANTVG